MVLKTISPRYGVRAFLMLSLILLSSACAPVGDYNLHHVCACVCECVTQFSLKLQLHIFTPQHLRVVGVLFSPMVSGWPGGRASGRAGGRAAENSLSGLYLRNRKV